MSIKSSVHIEHSWKITPTGDHTFMSEECEPFFLVVNGNKREITKAQADQISAELLELNNRIN